jgi:hypothetical protein
MHLVFQIWEFGRFGLLCTVFSFGCLGTPRNLTDDGPEFQQHTTYFAFEDLLI